jgi:hypothetical protein
MTKKNGTEREKRCEHVCERKTKTNRKETERYVERVERFCCGVSISLKDSCVDNMGQIDYLRGRAYGRF